MGGNAASPWPTWFWPPLCNISSNNVGLTDTEPLLPVPFPELITLLLTLLPTADTDTVDVAVFAAGEIGAKYVSDSLKGGITMFGSVISEKSVTKFILFLRRHEQIETKYVQQMVMVTIKANYVQHYTVAHLCNVHTSSAIPATWYHFTWRECFYGDFMSSVTIKGT